MVRKCFYSFHYAPDNARVSQVRNIGAIEGNKPATDNDWESITDQGDTAIKKWIAEQLSGKGCTIVLVGSGTANRKWINHEIIESWNAGKGVVGIHIHGLKDLAGLTSAKGANPFDHITFGEKKLSSVAKCYSPSGLDSKARYKWISDNIANAVEEAIAIRNSI